MAEDRASAILVGKFSKDRWLITHPVPCRGTQHRRIVGKFSNDVIMRGVHKELPHERIARCNQKSHPTSGCSYRRALVPFGELVMFMPMVKPKDTGETRNRVGIMLGLVDRSDEVVIGTTERVVKARTVHRLSAGQRGDAA